MLHLCITPLHDCIITHQSSLITMFKTPMVGFVLWSIQNLMLNWKATYSILLVDQFQSTKQWTKQHISMSFQITFVKAWYWSLKYILRSNIHFIQINLTQLHHHYHKITYKGLPPLNKLWKSLDNIMNVNQIIDLISSSYLILIIRMV